METQIRPATGEGGNMRGTFGGDGTHAYVPMHTPLLPEVLAGCGMGSRSRTQQFPRGLPMARDLAEAGEFPVNLDTPAPLLDRKRLVNGGKHGLMRRPKKPSTHEKTLWREAIKQDMQGWLDGAHYYSASGSWIYRRMEVDINPAFRFEVLQREKLLAADDLTYSQANAAAAIDAPINLPSRGHISQKAKGSRLHGRSKMLGMATADHQDAYKQLPLAPRGACAALVLPEIRREESLAVSCSGAWRQGRIS